MAGKASFTWLEPPNPTNKTHRVPPPPQLSPPARGHAEQQRARILQDQRLPVAQQLGQGGQAAQLHPRIHQVPHQLQPRWRVRGGGGGSGGARTCDNV